jgi:uncharacterized membrane protein YphA (DoxX/SURF4 family)
VVSQAAFDAGTSRMCDVMLLGTRLVLGSYLAVHGAQKLFGA